jgi:TRAP-type C4-dicarboxylate transport system permease small subunit
VDKNLELALMTAILIVITLAMMLQILTRVIANFSISWPLELCRYTFIWLMFLGFSYSIKSKTQIFIDTVVNMMPRSLRRGLDLVLVVFGLVFMAFLTYFAFRMTMNIKATGEVSVVMGIPMYWVYGSAFVGFALSTLRYLQIMVQSFSKKRAEGGEA